MNKLIARSILSVISVAVVGKPAFAASYTYTIINPPGVTYDGTTGINNAGQVIGIYHDPVQNKSIPFIYSNGTYQAIPPPSKALISLLPQHFGATGDVLGIYGKKRYRHAFTFSAGDKKAVELPGFPEGDRVYPGGMNASGEIVGQVVAEKVAHGFVDVSGNITFLDVPGAVATFANFVNSSGIIAGYYYENRKQTSFVYSNGTFNFVKVPKSIATEITFLADDGSFGGLSEVKTVNPGDPQYIGFTDIAGAVVTYQYPGAVTTTLVKALSAKENFGSFSVGSHFGAYHYLNGQYYELNVPVTGAVNISDVNASGSFTGTVTSGQNSTAFIATCVAGPGQCTN